MKIKIAQAQDMIKTSIGCNRVGIVIIGETAERKNKNVVFPIASVDRPSFRIKNDKKIRNAKKKDSINSNMIIAGLLIRIFLFCM